MQDFLHEIYFLPDHPELKKIKAVLQEYRKVFNFLCMVLEIIGTEFFQGSNTLSRDSLESYLGIL